MKNIVLGCVETITLQESYDKIEYIKPKRGVYFSRLLNKLPVWKKGEEGESDLSLCYSLNVAEQSIYKCEDFSGILFIYNTCLSKQLQFDGMG